MKHSVKLFALLFFFCVNCFVVKAQQKHFIYVQSEDQQPFAIVLNGKVFSASDYGYIIIPKLADSNYNFRVSFPMNKFPDQNFTCTINKKDAGFFLKNSSDGWALQNMQTQKLIMNNNAQVAQKDAFGDMLSEVVADSTLNKKNASAEQPSNATAIAAGGVAGAALVTAGAQANAGSSIDSVAQLEKISESKLDTGTSMLFVDKTQNGNDTISVFIPADAANTDLATNQPASPENATGNPQNGAVAVVAVPVINATQSNISTDSATVSENDVKTEKDTATSQLSNPFYSPEKKDAAEGAAAVSAAAAGVAAVSNAVKQDCANMISDGDMDKLKRKMFLQNNDNDMIQYAVKSLNKKCITTDQVKLLGSLFSSDDGRYTLYDALYNYVYDYGNYPLLANQIVDPYYKKRFAALLR
jgi:Domain of unknown function (DUF4476)